MEGKILSRTAAKGVDKAARLRAVLARGGVTGGLGKGEQDHGRKGQGDRGNKHTNPARTLRALVTSTKPAVALG